MIDSDNSFSAVEYDNLDHGHAVCPDQSGGLICGYVGPGGDIRINRLHGETGARLWGNEGTDVNVGGISAGPAHVVSDSAGGAWIVWHDTRAGAFGLYMQRYNNSGVAQLAAGGVRISTSNLSTGRDNLDIAVTPTGRLLVAFWEGNGLHVQRVFSDGSLDFGATGTIMTSDIGARPIRVFANGEGGVVVWDSNRAALPSGGGIVGNRFVTGSGAAQWGAEGATLFAAAAVSATLGGAAWDGTHLLVSWFHDPATANQIRAQKADVNGVVQWGTSATGAVVMTQQDTPFDSGNMRDVRLASDGAGGCILGWVDGRNFNQTGTGGFIHNTDLFAQRLNASGTPQWTAEGVGIDVGLGTQEDLRIVSDRAGGIYLAYTDLETSPDAFGDDASAARVNGAGTRLWKERITSDFPNDTQQFEPMLEVDGFGNVLVVWTDERDSFSAPDVYGIRLLGATGNNFVPVLTLLTPNGGESFVTPDSVRITWTSNLGVDVTLEYAITGQPRQTITTALNTGLFIWNSNGMLDGPAKIFISEASDGSPIDSSNATFTFCSVVDTPTVSVVAPSFSGGVASGDFNEDGIQDLAVGSSTGVQVTLGLGAAGAGNGSFGPATLIGLGASVRGLAAGDLNDDGRLDLVATTSAGLARMLGGGSGSVGNGTFGAPLVFTTGLSPLDVELADFNEDGILDAIVANDSAATVSRFLGSGSNGVGTGSFGTKFDLTVQSNPTDIAVQDLDHDGVLDLAVVNRFSSSISILMGTGTNGIGGGGFAAAVNFPTGSSPTVIEAANVNEDATPDLIVAHSGPRVTAYLVTFSGGAPVLTAGGTAVLGSGSLNSGALVARDFNRDGRLDVAVFGRSASQLQILYGQGPAGAGDGSFRFGGPLGSSAGTIGAQLATAFDANEDGVPDLVMGKHTGEVHVFEGSTCGTPLNTALAWTQTVPAQCMLLGALQYFEWTRGDGVAAVHVELSRDGGANWERLRSSVAVTGHLLWRVQNPTASTVQMRVVDAQNHNNVGLSPAAYSIRTGLDAATVFALPDTGRDAAIEDFNEDGIADLAVAHRGGVRVLRGTGSGGVGNGGFANLVDLPTASPASQVAAADLDDDGILDLVIGTDIGYEIRRGDGTAGVGDGNFGGPAIRDLGNVTRDLALGDFNEDGIQDLALAPRDSAFVLVALGEGANGIGLGAFGTPTRVTTPFTPRAIEIADANEDGVQDILAVSGGTATGSLGWLRGVSVGGKGTGAFLAAVSSATVNDPRSMAVLDLNGDHILDVIVGSGNANLRIHRGNGSAGLGNGTFTVTGDYKTYESGEAVSAIAVAPLDGVFAANGSPSRDLAVVSEDDDESTHWWLVSRDSTGPDNTAYAHASGFAFGKSEGLVLGDFNEDGYEDVALWSATAAQLRVALGNCSDPKDTFTSASFINSPNGGNLFPVGNNQNVTFDTQNHLWDIDLSRDSGTNWESVARYVAATSFSWTVAGPNTPNALIRLRRSHAPGTPVIDQSDAVFTIGSGSVDTPGESAPPAVSFSTAWPNPSRTRVRFELALPTASSISLDILDAQGRRVASLGGRDFPAGRHTITWEGRGMNGGSVPAGMYFAKLRAPNFEATRRIVRIP